MTNLEIEDVLSSIRRLVSENARGERPSEQGAEDVSDDNADAADGGVAGDAPKAQPRQEAQLLVLTPALRVGEDASDDAPSASEESSAPIEDGQAAHEALEEAVDDAVDKAALELAIEDAVHDAVEAAVSDEAAAGTQDKGDAAGAVPSFSHVENEGDSGELSTLEHRIAGLEAAVAERDDNWDPDGLGDDDNAGAPVDALRWEDSAMPLKGWEQDAPLNVEEAEVLVDNTPEPAIDLASFATSLADAEKTPERGKAAMQDDAKTASAGEERTSLNEAEQGDDAGAAADLFVTEDTVIDEEMLRDMVSEIVRRELQGSLGERITRNVRKLVRREIHRALAARELD
ncbi:hypothetical protein N4R57_16360 [Rhodobacteraceae bacterium D3-12]|nr:hypothetical protein N4R57_16360 [Rhodobacteraceae bacterium D3-12]